MTSTPERPSEEAPERRPPARRWRTAALIAMGVMLGSVLAAPPVSSHVGGSVAHLWTQHIRPKTDARYHTKAQANARYYDVGETVAQAGNADQLDGLDSSGFLAAGAKAADSDKLDGLDSTGFVQGRGSTKRFSASGPFASIVEDTLLGNGLQLFCATPGGHATLRILNRTDAALSVWGDRASTSELTFQAIPAGEFRNIHLNSVPTVTDRITVQSWTGTRSETLDAWVAADGVTCRFNVTLSSD